MNRTGKGVTQKINIALNLEKKFLF